MKASHKRWGDLIGFVPEMPWLPLKLKSIRLSAICQRVSGTSELSSHDRVRQKEMKASVCRVVLLENLFHMFCI